MGLDGPPFMAFRVGKMMISIEESFEFAVTYFRPEKSSNSLVLTPATEKDLQSSHGDIRCTFSESLAKIRVPKSNPQGLSS